MNLEGKRVYIKKDIEISGVAVGTNVTVQHVFPNEFFPVQLELDVPDSDGHRIKRVGYGDIGIIPEEGQKEELSVVAPEPNFLDLPIDGDIPI